MSENIAAAQEKEVIDGKNGFITESKTDEKNSKSEEITENEEEHLDENQMNEKKILESCKKHGLYCVPDLNDVLHLENQGFVSINGLDNFVNVKVIWLSCNQLTTIENLNCVTKLTQLYLDDNFIEEISGLDNLPELEVLFLARNCIRKVQGLSKCKKLQNIDLDSNRIKTAEALNGLLECPSLQIIHLAGNDIKDAGCLEIFKQMKELRVLHLNGNPFIRECSNYRRQLVTSIPELRYLDDSPVSAEDRRIYEAWKVGGKDAELEERRKISDEKEEKRRKDMKDFRRMQRDAAIKAGKDLRDFPELLSSDDEEMPKLMAEKSARIIENEDGTVSYLKRGHTLAMEEYINGPVDLDDVD